jgi:hypothetical protein
MDKGKFEVLIAGEEHLKYCDEILAEMAASAKVRGTGISRRNKAYLEEKMLEHKAVIALYNKTEWAGFCYIQTWSDKLYVSNSGLIVSPNFRNQGLAKAIKVKAFQLSRKNYPKAKLFGLTTGHAVMKINSELGYVPVPFSELTSDEAFWRNCESCVNYQILLSKQYKNCLCTAMLYDPEKESGLQKMRIQGSLLKGELEDIIKQRTKNIKPLKAITDALNNE